MSLSWTIKLKTVKKITLNYVFSVFFVFFFTTFFFLHKSHHFYMYRNKATIALFGLRLHFYVDAFLAFFFFFLIPTFGALFMGYE